MALHSQNHNMRVILEDELETLENNLEIVPIQKIKFLAKPGK